MRSEVYRNIPAGYVARQALAAVLMIVGITGFVLGIFMHYLGPMEGLLWGLQFLGGVIMVKEPKPKRIEHRLGFTLMSLAGAALTVAGALFLHAYYLLFGACLLLGIAVLVNLRRPMTGNL